MLKGLILSLMRHFLTKEQSCYRQSKRACYFQKQHEWIYEKKNFFIDNFLLCYFRRVPIMDLPLIAPYLRTLWITVSLYIAPLSKHRTCFFSLINTTFLIALTINKIMTHLHKSSAMGKYFISVLIQDWLM